MKKNRFIFEIFFWETDQLNSKMSYFKCAKHTKNFETWNLDCMFPRKIFQKRIDFFFHTKIQKIGFQLIYILIMIKQILNVPTERAQT